MTVITRAELHFVDLTPEAIRTDSIQSFVSQETPILRIVDSDENEGVGYTYTIGTGGSAVCALLADHLIPRLIGRDPSQIEAIWRDLKYSTHATWVGPITALSLAAIDTALWDLKCRRAGAPLSLVAGGAQHSAPVYSTERGWLHLSVDDLVEGALAAKANGLGGVKIKVGKPHAAEDVARLAAVREAVGDAFEIMVDCNQAFTFDEAIRRARMFERLNLGWIEEPLPADDVDGHVRLANQTAIPVAVGESLYSAQQFRDYLQRGGCSIVQVDVARIGGITPWLKVAHLAECFNTPVAPHFLMELHVSLVCAVPNGRWVEYIPQLSRLCSAAPEIVGGRIAPPQTPGIGIDWNWPAIEEHRKDGYEPIYFGMGFQTDRPPAIEHA
jgi:L-alanine-DL-glutamate epimerase-like enolase superfamily enzyme